MPNPRADEKRSLDCGGIGPQLFCYLFPSRNMADYNVSSTFEEVNMSHIHTARTLCERSPRVEIIFPDNLRDNQENNIHIGDRVTLYREGTPILAVVVSEELPGLFAGKIECFNTGELAFKDMQVNDSIYFQERHIFMCAS